jgi:glycosyltransferase involved in cell wall biosynthesis
MESRHLALFIRYLSVGGIQRNAVRMANEFARRGHRVDLVLAKGAGALAAEVRAEVRVVTFHRDRVWRTLPDLSRYLWQARPEVLFSAGPAVNLAAIWARALVPGRLRLVLSVQSNMSHYATHQSVWYGRYLPRLIRWFYPWADRVIAVSGGVRDDLAGLAPRADCRSCVIHNPVVDADLRRKADEPASHAWMRPAGPPVVLGVGRLVPEKNFALLLRAFARLAEAHADLRLLVLGEGRRRAFLEALAERLCIADRVDLPGAVTNPYPYMEQAALFVLSSETEGFGNVLVEALACGCPVVSTDCPGGPREILEAGRWGRLVPPGDAEALAVAMHAALAETSDADRLRTRAMDFAVDTVADRYLDVLLPNK